MRAADPASFILNLMGCTSPGRAPVLVKVCGVVRTDDALCAVAAGANLIGVIFAKSKRQASVAQARDVVDAVRRFGERASAIKAPERQEDFSSRCGLLQKTCNRSPLVVGVFLDQLLEEVVEHASATGIDAIQLHGVETTDFVKDVRRHLPDVWIMKVLHIPTGDQASDYSVLQAQIESYCEVCDALLMDTAVGSASGGTGCIFDWEVARRVQEEWGVPVFVAGGLSADNVANLVTSIKPLGVDVASGVEDAPGHKNAQKTVSFVRNAKAGTTTERA